MKRILFGSFATLLVGAGLAMAASSQAGRVAGVPKTQLGDSLQSWQYGGVDYATSSFTTNNTLLFTGEGEIVGFIASSNTAPSDFIAFRATNTVVAGETTDEIARVYLSSTTTYIGNGGQGMSYMFPAPIRVNRLGVAARTSVGTLNLVTYLFHKFGGQ